MNPSRAKRSRERLLDRALVGITPKDREKWALLDAKPLESVVVQHANEREAEDIAILLMAL